MTIFDKLNPFSGIAKAAKITFYVIVALLVVYVILKLTKSSPRQQFSRARAPPGMMVVPRPKLTPEQLAKIQQVSMGY